MRTFCAISLSLRLLAESPADRLQLLEPAEPYIQQQTDNPDHDHRRHYQIVTLAGISRIDNQISKTGISTATISPPLLPAMRFPAICAAR